MSLLKYIEYINTECRIQKPILSVKALKVDANTNSLKSKLGCKNLKSCDYFKRGKQKFYFIEISDFNAQFMNLASRQTSKDALKEIKLEIRLKLSETLIIYQKLIDNFNFKQNNRELSKKALLSVCRNNTRDSIFLDKITRELTKHYCPEHLSSIKLIPYTQIEKELKK